MTPMVITILPVFCFLVNQTKNKPTTSSAITTDRGKKRGANIFLKRNIFPSFTKQYPYRRGFLKYSISDKYFL
jgi:hypothetical protein